MDHHGRVSINDSPHGVAGFCFELILMGEVRTHNESWLRLGYEPVSNRRRAQSSTNEPSRFPFHCMISQPYGRFTQQQHSTGNSSYFLSLGNNPND